MRILNINEMAAVAGGENTLPTVTITYNSATGTTSYSGASGGTGAASPSNASALLFGTQQTKANNMREVEAALQVATYVLGVAAIATLGNPPVAAALGVAGLTTGALSLAAGSYK